MFEGLFQPMHLLVIFGIALLVFGPKKLPELGKGIGEGIRGFKSAMKEEEKPANVKPIINEWCASCSRYVSVPVRRIIAVDLRRALSAEQ